MGPAQDGAHSFANIMNAGAQFDLYPVAVHVDRYDLATMPAPAIVHCELPSLGERARLHFAVAVAWDDVRVFVLDPPHGVQRVPWDRFSPYWTGNTMLFADTPEDAERLRAALAPPLGVRIARWISIVVIVVCGALLLSRGFSTIAARQTTAANRVLSFAGRLSFARGTWALVPSGRVLLAILPIALSLGGIATYTCAPETSRLGAWMRGSPWIGLPKGILDFGELDPGEQHQSVAMPNLGRSPLVVEFVESNCGCVVADVEGEVVAPGGDLILPLSLGVTPGRRYVELTVHCNDPRSPLRWTVSWQGAANPLLVPARIFGDDVSLRSLYQRTMRLVFPASVGGPVPRLVAFECDDPRIHVSQGALVPFSFRPDPFTPYGSAIGHLDLDVSVTPPMAPESIRTVCHLDVELGERTARLKLPIAVSFVGDIRAEPSSVLLCAACTNDMLGVSRAARLVGTRAPGAVIEFRGVPSWLKATAAASTDNPHPSLLFKIQETQPSQFRSASIRVVVHDGESETEVPLTVLAFAPSGD